MDVGGCVTIVLERSNECDAVVFKLLPAKRLNALQTALAFLDEGLGSLGHDGMPAASVGDGHIALFHNFPEGTDDKLVDIIHGEEKSSLPLRISCGIPSQGPCDADVAAEGTVAAAAAAW